MGKPDQRVLLVDDDTDLREALRDTLADEGYETVEARDGREALDYLHAHSAPPLILLDWNMSRMNGPEFMEEVAKDPALSEIPVVLLTADASALQKSRTAQFVAYLVKPVNLDALFSLLDRYCG